MGGSQISAGRGRARTLKVGITGGVGSGKSLVLRRLEDFSVPVQSADELARKAVEPGTRAYEKIVEHFGSDVLTPSGTIDRPKLRRLITADDRARKALEDFVHPEVLARMAGFFEAAEKEQSPVAAVEVPLLFETGLQSRLDFVIMVSSSRENRIRRIMARDGVSRAEAEALMKIQMPESEKKRLSHFVIDNNGSLEQAGAQVDRIYEKLLAEHKKLTEKG